MNAGAVNKEIVWSRMNLKEVLPELPCPLTLSIFARANRTLFIEQFKKMGYSLPEDAEYIKAFYGRLYFNMNIWHKTYSDFGADPEFSQRAFGGFQSKLMNGFDKPSVFTRIKMVPAYIKTMRLFSNINKISKENFSMIREGYERYSNIDMRNLSDGEIFGYFESLEELSKRDLTVIIGAGTSASYCYLMEFLKKLVPVEDLNNVLNQLVTGSEGIISANQSLSLVRLAGEAKGDRKVLEALEGEIDSAYNKLGGTGFRDMLDRFLREFGHRGLYETDVESPRYSENPASVLKLVKNYLDAGVTDPKEIMDRQKNIREDAISGVLKHIQKNRLKKKSFLSRLENYERFLALREENRYHTVMVIALARRVYLEIGRRFAERGILGKQHDIFFLTIPEVQSLLTGEKNDFKNIVNERKSERERNSRLHVPDVIAGDVIPEMIKEKVRETKKVFEGYAASPGIVQGIARIIRSPEEFGRFKPSEILVAPTTDPMWSTLFPVAKAVVTEMGGILSHAAIVAREYGTPCVVNVRGIIDALEDGDLIEVDGKRGSVEIITEGSKMSCFM